MSEWYLRDTSRKIKASHKARGLSGKRLTFAPIYGYKLDPTDNLNRPERIDHRSYKRQGKKQIPTIHLGTTAHQLEQRGIRTERGDINRAIKLANAEIENINTRLQKLETELQQLQADELQELQQQETPPTTYQTYLWETELGTDYEADDEKGGLLIPVADVQYAMAWIYHNVDWDSNGGFDSFYVSEKDPNYLWLPDGFGQLNTSFTILMDTLTLENDIYKIDVSFYEDSPGLPELFVFTYYFKPDLYKDLIPCFTFVRAERVIESALQ